VRYAVIFESNHGEANKSHIELVKKHIHFESVEYLGRSDIPEKPHYLWICRKWSHDIRYPFLQSMPIEFVPLDAIKGWSKDILLEQKGGYSLDTDRYRALVADIKKRGIRDPLVLEDGLKGFQGAHRYFAAKELGYKDVPCKVMRGLFIKHLNK